MNQAYFLPKFADRLLNTTCSISSVFCVLGGQIGFLIRGWDNGHQGQMIGSSSVLLKTPNNFIYSRPPRKTPDCRAPRPPSLPIHSKSSILPTPAPFRTHHMLIDEKGPWNQTGWKDIKQLVLCWQVRLTIPGSASLSEACLRPIKGSLMKHGEGITTNANWQMSCIVPGYNKQYGCLSWISMIIGSAFWRLCFDCCFFFLFSFF